MAGISNEELSILNVKIDCGNQIIDNCHVLIEIKIFTLLFLFPESLTSCYHLHGQKLEKRNFRNDFSFVIMLFLFMLHNYPERNRLRLLSVPH